MTSRRRWFRRILLLSFVVGGCWLGTPGARVSAYEVMSPPAAFANKETFSAAMSAANTAMKESGALQPASREALKAYVEYEMAKMTEPSVKPRPDEHRNTIITRLINPPNLSPEAKTLVAKTVIAKSNEIIAGQYFPPAKINAMLLLGEAGKIAPKDTLSPLFGYAVNTKAPAHLRCLALLALEERVRGFNTTDLPPANRAALAAAIANITRSLPTSVQEEKAHWWLVRRSYDMLGTLYKGGTPSKEGALQALEHFMNPAIAPSVRLSAAQYLTYYDMTRVDDATKNKMLVATAQLLDQEVVGWYEYEDDKTKAASGATGMMGGMGGYGGDMGGAMSSSSDMGGYDGGMSMSMGGDPYGGATAAPRPVDTQSWDLRLSRRKLNTYCQIAHVLLKGNGINKEGKEKDLNPTGRGIMETELPEPLRRPSGKLLEALELVQTDINDRNLTTVSSLMTKSVRSLQALRDAAEMIPGIAGADGSIVVPSFDQLSPRKKSQKKADKDDSLDNPTPPAQPAGGDPNAPADPNQPANANPAGAQPRNGAQPGNAQPGNAQPGNAAQPANAQPGNAPAAGAAQPAGAGQQPQPAAAGQ